MRLTSNGAAIVGPDAALAYAQRCFAQDHIVHLSGFDAHQTDFLPAGPHVVVSKRLFCFPEPAAVCAGIGSPQTLQSQTPPRFLGSLSQCLRYVPCASSCL